jgi:hypothetical protein
VDKSKTSRTVDVSASSGGGSTARSGGPELVNLTPVGVNPFSSRKSRFLTAKYTAKVLMFLSSWYSEEQFYVLRKGSSINGVTFALWDDPPRPLSYPAQYEYVLSALPTCGSIEIETDVPTSLLYSDPDNQPSLSPEQQRFSPIWRRPHSHSTMLASNFSDSSSYRTSTDIQNKIRTHKQLLPQDILQHVVTDCSVCASISVCLEHSRRFSSSVSVIFISRDCQLCLGVGRHL